MLELAILGLLKEQALHGYELKKRLTDTLGPFSSVSFGSLYPALARLEAAEALRVVEADDVVADAVAGSAGVVGTFPSVPMTGSIAGEAAAFRARRAAAVSRRNERSHKQVRSSRTRKVYAITARGEELFEELLEAESASGDDERSFNLKLAFCRYLPPERRLGLFERRRAQLVERAARARSGSRTHRDRMDSYTRSLLDHGTEATERDISWLDRLIATERQGTTSDRPPSASPPSDRPTAAGSLATTDQGGSQ